VLAVGPLDYRLCHARTESRFPHSESTWPCSTSSSDSHLLDATPQRSQRRDPFPLIERLSRSKVDPQSAEFCRASRLRCIRVHVDATRDLEPNKTGSDDRRPELCFQQSSGDSALPQIDVALRFVAYRLLDQNVADLKATAWLEHARHLLKPGKLVGEEV
jgi:hypothetical protein